MEKIKVNLFLEEDEIEIQRMLNEFYNCPQAVKFVGSLGISDELIKKYITKIYSFVSDLKYCKSCPGCDKCQKENPCFINKVTFENDVVGNDLVPCKELIKKMNFQKQFLIKDFDDEWMNLSLKDINQTNERKLLIKKYLDYRKGESQDWLYITGGINTGRSFVAAMLTVDAARNNNGPICFINASKRIKELNDLNFTDKEEFQNELIALSETKILVIDDFGNEYKNDFVRDAILLEILTKRASNKLLTIFTSDFTIEEIISLHSNNAPGKIRAKQLGNIISKMCKSEISLGDLSVY